jgi:hypothetical protein
MENFVKKSIQSAAAFNSGLMKDRRIDRRTYFDLQTFEVHYPKGMLKTLPSSETKMGTYPIAVLPGQFQDYFKRYSSQELNYFPVNTTLYSPHKLLRSVYTDPSDAQPVDTDDEVQIEKQGSAEDNCTPNDKRETFDACENQKESSIPGDVVDSMQECFSSQNSNDCKLTTGNNFSNSQQSTTTTTSIVSTKNSSCKGKDIPLAKCQWSKRKQTQEKSSPLMRKSKYIVKRKGHLLTPVCPLCSQTERNKEGDLEELVSCAECHTSSHPTCLDLTKDMIPIIKGYPWQCMDCKTCVKCKDSHDEEKMMFCDHCDRGYHTFCVGLETLPAGRWECPSCSIKEEDIPIKVKPKRGRPFKYPRLGHDESLLVKSSATEADSVNAMESGAVPKMANPDIILSPEQISVLENKSALNITSVNTTCGTISADSCIGNIIDIDPSVKCSLVNVTSSIIESISTKVSASVGSKINDTRSPLSTHIYDIAIPSMETNVAEGTILIETSPTNVTSLNKSVKAKTLENSSGECSYELNPTRSDSTYIAANVLNAKENVTSTVGMKFAPEEIADAKVNPQFHAILGTAISIQHPQHSMALENADSKVSFSTELLNENEMDRKINIQALENGAQLLASTVEIVSSSNVTVSSDTGNTITAILAESSSFLAPNTME